MYIIIFVDYLDRQKFPKILRHLKLTKEVAPTLPSSRHDITYG
jgi:hypothetical protein